MPVRIDRQEATAQQLAAWLVHQPEVKQVHYCGLSSHPQFDLARRQQSGPGFVVSFRLKDKGRVNPFLKALEIVTLAPSLGSFATLICKPCTMTHEGMCPQARERAGITDDLVRLSIGLEEASDLILDLSNGLKK